jgi:hypothetical protein
MSRDVEAYQPDGYRGCAPCWKNDCCREKPCFVTGKDYEFDGYKNDCRCGGYKKFGYDGYRNFGYGYNYSNVYGTRCGTGGARFWEISETNRCLPGAPAARLHKALGHNYARRSGQQYAAKIHDTGAYGEWN